MQCDDRSCTGAEACCITGTGDSCGTSCSDGALYCDDAADCAAQGLVCCVDVYVNGGGDSAGLKGSTCRALEDCQASSETPGPTRLRACDPSASDCAGKGCAPLTSRHPTVFPNHPIFVCD